VFIYKSTSEIYHCTLHHCALQKIHYQKIHHPHEFQFQISKKVDHIKPIH